VDPVTPQRIQLFEKREQPVATGKLRDDSSLDCGCSDPPQKQTNRSPKREANVDQAPVLVSLHGRREANPEVQFRSDVQPVKVNFLIVEGNSSDEVLAIPRCVSLPVDCCMRSAGNSIPEYFGEEERCCHCFLPPDVDRRRCRFLRMPKGSLRRATQRNNRNGLQSKCLPEGCFLRLAPELTNHRSRGRVRSQQYNPLGPDHLLCGLEYPPDIVLYSAFYSGFLEAAIAAAFAAELGSQSNPLSAPVMRSEGVALPQGSIVQNSSVPNFLKNCLRGSSHSSVRCGKMLKQLLPKFLIPAASPKHSLS